MNKFREMLKLALETESKPLKELSFEELQAAYLLKLLADTKFRKAKHLALWVEKDSMGRRYAFLRPYYAGKKIYSFLDRAYLYALQYRERMSGRKKRITLADLLRDL